jgi:hypothetical protein
MAHFLPNELLSIVGSFIDLQEFIRLRPLLNNVKSSANHIKMSHYFRYNGFLNLIDHFIPSQITSIDLCGFDIIKDDLQYLSKLVNLTHLCLSQGVCGTRWLNGLTNLVHLSLKQCFALTNENLLHLN